MLFVTVGTTNFDSLIEVINTNEFYKSCVSLGISKLIVQTGLTSSFIPKQIEIPNLTVTYVTLVEDYDKTLHAADYCIGHSGAGTIINNFLLKKQFAVAINESLKENHQWELAEQLFSLKALHIFELEDPIGSLERLVKIPVSPYEISQSGQLADIIEDMLNS